MSIGETKIRYQKCSDVSDFLIYQAFMDGFSDYIVKFKFSEEEFINRFFGPEGNSRENSFIAFDQERPVGVILSGVKVYESIKTMRCGTLAIHPEYRGKGISQRLFELHKQEANNLGCKQLFLEVIVGNDRAINFYKRLGYEKIYDIVYYTNSNLSKLYSAKSQSDLYLKKIDFSLFKQGIEERNYHINWQNDLEFIAEIPTNTYYGALNNGQLKGALCISPSGKISFLMIEKTSRGKGLASALLKTAAEDLQLTQMSTCFPNNSLLELFFKKQGFAKDSLTQFEMYMLL
ncbi:ribosomal protein S18 acetylase RimI-like enzyme [Neobacillus cucumis]|nr:ribosomal protein S18 acetylase RimI-like enzyme [Neobacillus cucumis]